MVGTDGDRTQAHEGQDQFSLGGVFDYEISCPWLATDCILFHFLNPDCLPFLREKFRCRVWEYDFIAIHVITAVFVLRIETASTLELVTEPVS